MWVSRPLACWGFVDGRLSVHCRCSSGVSVQLLSRPYRFVQPVLAYIVVICSMVIAAAGVAWSQPDNAHLLLAGAAVVFVLSDLCVAFDRFIAPGPWVRTLGLPLYFGAQWMFVQGAAAALTT